MQLHTCDTSWIMWECPAFEAHLLVSCPGNRISTKCNYPIPSFPRLRLHILLVKVRQLSFITPAPPRVLTCLIIISSITSDYSAKSNPAAVCVKMFNKPVCNVCVYVCLFYSGFTLLSTIFLSYRMWQGDQCSL